MNSEEIKRRVGDWVAYCGRSAQISCLPYIDAPVKIEGFEFVWETPRRDSALIRLWQDALEEQLLRNPANRPLRVAALRPFLAGGLSNPWHTTFRSTELCLAFRYLARLCVPEALTSLADLKFELYNLYLAADWHRAAEVLRRIAILDLLPARELYLLRGQFWFLSVFGRRIAFELFNRGFEYEFFWPIQIPLPEEKAEAVEVARALCVFERPEILAWGSPAHWVLTAWCTNPRAPKPLFVDPDPIFVGDPDEPRNEEPAVLNGNAEERAEEGAQKYIHEKYREFEPIAPPELSQNQRERLLDALQNLREGFAGDQVAGRPYLPIIARTLFCLGRFEEAAEKYDELEKLRLVFVDPITGDMDSEWDWLLCFHRCLCLRGAGKQDAAISALAEFAERHTIRLPDSPNKTLSLWGTGWWIAKWYSEQGRYHEAAQFLKTELESLFSPPECWQLSTILALESVARDEEGLAAQARQCLADRPDIQQIMNGMISDMWPAFRTLSPDSALRWLSAIYFSFAEYPLKDLKRISLSYAVREYGLVVEQEFKTKIFLVFCSEVKSDRDRSLRARADSHDDFDNKFYRFLTGKTELTLGAMIHAIEDCQASRVQTDVDFSTFLQIHAPELTKVTPALKTVLELRNSATHGNANYDTDTVRRMSTACRAILESLYTQNQK